MKRQPGPAITLTLLVLSCLVPCAAADDEAFPATLAAPVEFDPPSFVPGQVVAMYARLDAGTTLWRVETMTPALPGSLADGPRIMSASLTERSGAPLMVVRFVAWHPGQGTLPSISVGGLATPPLKYSCSSSLAAGGTEPPMPIGQLDPPGLFPRLYLVGGMALVSAIALALGARRLVPWLRLFKARRAFERVRREFDALLGRIEGQTGNAAAWAELCAGLRVFLTKRTGLDWLALTSVEAAAMPPGSLPVEVQPAAAAILSMGDEARFAGRLGLDFDKALATARVVGDRIDAALEPRAARKEGA